MKRLALTLAAVSVCISVCAQTDEEFKAKYNRQVNSVGAAGVGVEYIVNKWEEAYPDSKDMLMASFSLYFTKSRQEQVVAKPGQARYLGEEPILSLNDSLGNKVNYFTDYVYDDELFGKAVKYVDRLIEVVPDDLVPRFYKIDVLVAYEKESPDMAASDLSSLIDYNSSVKPSWKADGEAVQEDYFVAGVQEYCHEFFKIASPASYEAFRMISEKMNRLYPSDPVFLSNLGSYWYVAQSNSSKAMNYYKKVLKIAPKDYTAIKNCVLIARKEKNVKLEKKYLPLLIEVTPSEKERASAEARLKNL